MEMNVHTRIAALEDENWRLVQAKAEMEKQLDAAWSQTKGFHSISDRTAAENEKYKRDNAALKESKRKLESELSGALSENSRLQMLSRCADAKKTEVDAQVLHATMECKQREKRIKQLETELSETRTAVESLKLRKTYLSSSLQNANAKVTGLTAEVLELKAKQTQFLKTGRDDTELRTKVTSLQRKVDDLTAKNEELGKLDAAVLTKELSELKSSNTALAEENKKLKDKTAQLDAQNKDMAARLEKIAKFIIPSQ